MRLALLPLLLLSACRADSEAASGEAASGMVQPQESPCESRNFDGSRFTICSAEGLGIEVRTAGPDGQPYRSFAALEAALGERAEDVAFAMNAGMYDEEGEAIGLLIEEGEELHSINRRDASGNFHMKPNGVFLVRRDGSAEVVTSEDFEASDDIAFASQSGPMLLIDGKLHPRFQTDGQSRHFRNGVGITDDGTALFAISEDPVSFGKFARLYRDELGVDNALYFDGSVSSLWDPANGRRDAHSPIGPMVVAFESE